MGKDNSDAQNNEKCSYNFEHPRISCAIPTKRPTFCTVKEIPLSGLNFPPHDDFEQHHTAREMVAPD
jgi:hypothetical protein